MVCVIPGDLHLTEPGRENHCDALAMVDEVNALIRPNFVQFIGDNVQHATPAQFRLFQDLYARLQVPWHALVGDHDVHNDAAACGFREFVGEPYGAFSVRGFRFLCLNTLEHRPIGLSARQLNWFREELDRAQEAGERAVVFQHHYPFKVYETFAGPGLDDWRAVVQTKRITAIFTGHTHYGQMANDGRNVAITTRSIGDPEEGPPGYSIVYLYGDDLAITYRPIVEKGPIVLITHPRELLLATGPKHVVRGPDCCRVRIWSAQPLKTVRGRLDDGAWFSLRQETADTWTYPVSAEQVTKGLHTFAAQAIDAAGREGVQHIRFPIDPTGRFTAVPGVWPPVSSTAFC